MIAMISLSDIRSRTRERLCKVKEGEGESKAALDKQLPVTLNLFMRRIASDSSKGCKLRDLRVSGKEKLTDWKAVASTRIPRIFSCRDCKASQE